ncbi:MAG TPA: twin-arginine translocation signal domain-containing protein, partial [Candidatus Limnocylindrales bacterium]|nr:twin-arginine translocation signal domain-containing protein [Candidatus Limnocylindrales bacterium]
MELSRRDLLKLLAIGAGAGLAPNDVESAARAPARLLDFEALGNVTLLHVTDPHAMLLPVYYREPDTLIGVGPERGTPPFLTGAAFLKAYAMVPGSAEAHACTHLDFSTLAARYGAMGGYAHLATVV